MENKTNSGEYAAIGSSTTSVIWLSMATPVGLEPTTSSLEGWRSIRLATGSRSDFIKIDGGYPRI